MAKLRRTAQLIESGFGDGGVSLGPGLADETDKGCALVAAEFLSDTLELYLRRIMRQKEASENEIREFLVNGTAPLGNFGSRIKAAHWFNLIGRRAYDALENVREIRNRCAHRAGKIDFTDTALQPYVRGLEEFLADRLKQDDGTDTVAIAVLEHDKIRPLTEFAPQRVTFMKSVALIYIGLRVRGLNDINHSLPPSLDVLL